MIPIFDTRPRHEIGSESTSSLALKKQSINSPTQTSAHFIKMPRSRAQSKEHLLFNTNTRTFSFVSTPDLLSLFPKRLSRPSPNAGAISFVSTADLLSHFPNVHQIPVLKYANKIDVYVTDFERVFNNSKDGKLKTSVGDDQKEEYFWGVVRLPSKVIFGRLLGWWKALYVLEE